MSQHRHFTRRSMLRRSVVAFGTTAAFSALPRAARAVTQPPAIQPSLSLFDYAQVEFAPGPLERQFDENHELLLNMSEDSLLRPFRIREGMSAPGKDMGGWYDTYDFAPAHAFGQWLSALARYYATTHDEPTRAKINRLILGYAATIDPAGKFYLENRFPAYIYDKLVCGLIDAYAFANHPASLATLARATDAALPHLPPHAMPHLEIPINHHEDFTLHAWDESYTLPENLFLAALRTGDSRYRDLAQRFLYHEYFDALARGENALPGKHAYSHVNALSSAAQAYLVLGDETYLRAAKNAFAMLEQQSYATGGWGPDEHFVPPESGKLGESLTATHAGFETPCGAYAHFKITRYLLRISRDPHYGDSMERVLYNTVLGAKPIQPDGSAFYYSDYNFQGHKFYHDAKWPCCSGTLPQIAADYRISAYLAHPRGIYVNLYAPSTLMWKSSGAEFSLRQTTEYPYNSRIQLDLAASHPATFSIFLRIPQWASGASISISGKSGFTPLAPGTFAEIRREWKNRDRIELDLPLTTRLEPVDAQHPDTVALLRGPLVLFPLAPDPARSVTRSDLLSVKEAPNDRRLWIAETAGLRFKTFVDIEDESYSTYSRVQSAPAAAG